MAAACRGTADRGIRGALPPTRHGTDRRAAASKEGISGLPLAGTEARISGLPTWIRYIAYLWLFAVLISRGCTSSHDHSEKVSPATARRLKQLSDNYQG